jgi:hypothetical protein
MDAKLSLKVSKTTEFHADFKSVEKGKRNAHEKVISKTNLMNMSKSSLLLKFIKFVLQRNIYCSFSKTFSTDLKSA